MPNTSLLNYKAYFPFLDGDYVNDSEDYPKELMEDILASELAVINVPIAYGGGIQNSPVNSTELLHILKLIGARDLSAGRIYEGHVNAMLLIGNYGTEEQKERFFTEAKEGVLFGIWNSQIPSDPLSMEKTHQLNTLKGGKVFCSGANHVLRPIVTADFEDKQQMVILNMEDYNLKEDFTYWQPLGMKASVSCGFDFTSLEIADNQLLGGADYYYNQPDFSGGAVRFAAVQLGGADAMIKSSIKHLKSLNRTEDINQKNRMAKLAILKNTGELWLEKAGKAFDNRYQQPEKCIYIANMFRTIVRDICEEIMQLSEKSVGLQGFLKPHAMERIHRDMTVYLKQPGPDGALLAVGDDFINKYSDEK